MKKVSIVAVGKLKEKYITDGIAEYAKRLSRFCEFDVRVTAESARQDVEEEKVGLLKEMKGYNVLTDIEGESVTSEQLAVILKKALESSDRVNFLIGSSRGVSDEVRKKADKIISFGRATFAHQLFRLVLAEQIYRAFTINEGMPYHK